ncbi:MAG: undecaprenyl/decaprenyl-phosphate alpha-N-acetylglucosaminyl 1-phosphate transferase [Gammaproteobacteria bacterium]|nr:undecaprenyl/decaprenyl-phosphate alpha-N-acetylglucosaminyl 1-phosphate transferase [Gammaproteobacteria bacterium]
MNPFFDLTLAVAVSMLIIPLMRRVAPRLGLVDMPDPRKVHTVPIPRVGGWGITLGTLLPLLLVFKLEPLVQSYVIGCLVLFVFGIWDDARTIGHWPKFIGQLAAAGAVVFYGNLWVSRVPFIDGALPAELGKPFTMFALIGVINAINHSDGLDGLAGGESVLSLLALAILGYMSGSALVLGCSLATIGGIFGFLRYNSHPAHVFMGDSGSQVLGFTLGFLVVYLTQIANHSVSAALPLLILGLPLADILSVLYQRVHGGMNWFKATRNHVHHRLLQVGFDHYETVVIIYLIQAGFVVSAVLVRYESDLVVTLIYAAGIVPLFWALSRAERRHWPIRSVESRVTQAVDLLKRSRAVIKGPLLLIAGLTPIVMLVTALGMARVPPDFAVAAAVLAVLPATQLLWPQAMRPALLRLAVYATAIFPAYLLISSPEAISSGARVLIAVITLVLALAIVVYVRFGAEQRFGTTPTDYLIVCGVVALMVFGGIEVNSRAVVEAVLLAPVLSYACEVIVGTAPRSACRRLLQCSTLGSLLIIALRGVL